MNHGRPFSLVVVVVFLLTAFCLVPTAFSQSTTATLSGTVEDEKGAVIPGASVVVINIGTRLERQTTTNGEGYFVVTLLPPSTYKVRVENQGFAPVEVQNVVLNVNDRKALQIQLKAGNISEQVQVVGEAPLINESPAVATTIDRTFVSNLPLNGRSFSSLVLLTPGVTVATSGAFDHGQFSVNGQRASTNYFTVDGVSANVGISGTFGGAGSGALAGAYPGTSTFGGTNNLVSIDALEEFKIQTSSYTAESGRQPGAQIQIITRSGKNDFHGTLFEYFRNEALDARNYFNFAPLPKPPLRQNHFGGTFSGPLPFLNFGEGGPSFTRGKDRTFFFFSYEGQRLRLPSSGVKNVPSLRLRQIAAPTLQPMLNAFSQPTGAETTTTTVCIPDPSDPSCAPNGRRYSGAAPFNYSLANPSNLDATSIRIDHVINKKTFLFARFNEAPSETQSGIELKSRNIAETRTFTAGVTFVANTQLSNEFRFNYSRQQGQNGQIFTTLGGAVPIDPSLLASGYDRLAFITIRSAGGSFSISGGTFSDNFQNQFNIVDNFLITKGPHALKFGIDFRRLAPIQETRGGHNFTIDGEPNIIAGRLTTLSISARLTARPRFDNFSAFAQDTWKASRRLTLDYGMRWEFNPVPTEAGGNMPPLAIDIVGTDVRNASLAPANANFYKTFYTAFAPRLGAAYVLNQKGGLETVIRGGFGLYYDLGNGTVSNGWPITRIRTLPNSVCPTVVILPIPQPCAAPPDIGPLSLPTTSTVIAVNEKLKLPYSLHWNVTVDQSLGKSHSISLAYVASAARRLLTVNALNQARRDPVTGILGSRPNANFGTINLTQNGPTADYNSMQAQYRTRFRQKLQALVNYTWSHATDEVSNDLNGLFLERGSADFDVRHNMSAAIHYEIPALNWGPIVRHLFRDWSFETIAHLQSGRPLNVTLGSVIDETGTLFSARPDYISGVPLYIDDPTVPGGRRFNASAFARPPGVPGFPTIPARQGSFGRNVLRELPLYQVDVSLGRTIGITERLKLQLKGEAFNVFNHPMFGGYQSNYTISTFGVPTTTMNSSLGGLSSLYQLGGPRSIQLSARISF
ncbi:MAG TPA: carboxypeptidase regulatory-like domain-containing protein [Pyrinomonadaceae bacterium]|nr:carboxypeptidase regulatory-like domain-containing protein [Pyrinomonadaceae bacterium]